MEGLLLLFISVLVTFDLVFVFILTKRYNRTHLGSDRDCSQCDGMEGICNRGLPQ